MESVLLPHLLFHYEYHVKETDKIILTDELTTFNIRNNGVSWSIPASFETYELLYRTLPLNDVEDANTPFTFKTPRPQVYKSITGYRPTVDCCPSSVVRNSVVPKTPLSPLFARPHPCIPPLGGYLGVAWPLGLQRRHSLWCFANVSQTF